MRKMTFDLQADSRPGKESLSWRTVFLLAAALCMTWLAVTWF